MLFWCDGSGVYEVINLIFSQNIGTGAAGLDQDIPNVNESINIILIFFETLGLIQAMHGPKWHQINIYILLMSTCTLIYDYNYV